MLSARTYLVPVFCPKMASLRPAQQEGGIPGPPPREQWVHECLGLVKCMEDPSVGAFPGFRDCCHRLVYSGAWDPQTAGTGMGAS